MTPFAKDIWLAEGPPVTAALGFHYPTRMAVIQLPEGDLWIWSPIPLTDALKAELLALGPVTQLIAPNALHHLSMPDWQAAFPKAHVHAAPGVAAKQPGLRIDAQLDGASPWAGLERVMVPNAIAPEAVFHHVPSGTVLVCDLIQHLSQGWFTGWRALVARLDLMTAPMPEVPRKFRLALRRPGAAAALDTILDWPARHLVMAHGPPADGAALAHAFRWHQRNQASHPAS